MEKLAAARDQRSVIMVHGNGCHLHHLLAAVLEALEVTVNVALAATWEDLHIGQVAVAQAQ